MKRIFVSDAFDNMHYPDFVFLKKAAEQGKVAALLWSDDVCVRMNGKLPKYTEPERYYFASSIKYISSIGVVPGVRNRVELPGPAEPGDAWMIRKDGLSDSRRKWAADNGIECICVGDDELEKRFELPVDIRPPRHGVKKVVVTGCYDWLHSGHIRFFEETSGFGSLYVIVGCDKAIKSLKGDSKPMFPEWKRFFMVDAVKYVTQGLVSTGLGWMDAENEILRIKPDVYIVNEDGDRPEKAEFCKSHGIEYRVLKRLPKEGLPKRTSTDLRGF